MGWQQELRQASFKGIKFGVKVAGGSFGRDRIRHRFPLSDVTYNEDTGRSPRDYQIEGFLIGDNYLDQLIDLTNAVEEETTGTLVHPFYGEIEVDCNRITPQHDSEEQGMVRFVLEFWEAGSKVFLRSEDDTPEKSSMSVKDCLTAEGTAFQDQFIPKTTQGKYLDSVYLAIAAVANAVAVARSDVGQVADFAFACEDIVSRVTGLAQDAGELLNAITNIVTFGIFDQTYEDIIDSTDNKAKAEYFKDAIRRLAGLFTFDCGVPFKSQNTDSINTLVRISALNGAVQAAATANYESVDEAFYFRDLLTGQIDSVLLSDIPDDIFESLQTLRANCVTDLEARAANLPMIKEITISAPLPSIVVAFNLYGDVNMEEDILRRNNLDDPCFVPANVPLKVLLNG